MLKSPGFALKIAALGLVLVGLIVILGIPSQPVDPTAPVLPTRIILSTATQTPQVNSVPVTSITQPSALPPTALPSEIEFVALQPTDNPPTATVQPSPQPISEPIVLPLSQQPVPNQVTIQFAPNTSIEQQQAYIHSLGGHIETTIAPLNTVVVTLPDTAQALLSASPIVVQAEPDYFVQAQQSTPNDPYYSQQWAIPVIKAAEAWPLLPANTTNVVVAVIDSGICATHPDLAGRILLGYDFVQGDSTPQDEYGHGCEVAGVIAANTNNSMGVAGVAPHTLVMPLRVLDSAGNGTTSNVAAAITYATDNGAAIINLSLGGANPSTTMENAVNYAVAQGVLVVAAAGNTGGTAQPGVIYPAAYANVVAVASIDHNLQLSSFSSYGPEVDLLAPGRNIMTTKMNGSYGNASGTSFAAPQVSGIAALEMAQGRTLMQGGGIAQVYVPVPTVTPDVNVRPEQPPDVVIEEAPVPTDTWVVVLQAGSNPNDVAALLGYENLGQVGAFEDTYLFRIPSSSSSLQAAEAVADTLQDMSQIIRFEQQIARKHYPRDPNDDPLYVNGDQWHLNNTLPFLSGNDVNVIPAWNAGFTGSGVQIAIVDDGLQHTHPDLSIHYNATGSYDFDLNDNDPAPDLSTEGHGTAAAGVAAASDNTTCGVGAAYNADLSGIRLIARQTTDAIDGTALTYHNGKIIDGGNTNTSNDIFSNSWGPSDNGSTLKGPGISTLQAFNDGVYLGRGGLGNIYVWAAGNGRGDYYQGNYYQFYDNINADGYANSRFVIAVGAVDPFGKLTYYSEPGAAMFVTAPSSAIFNGTAKGIATTDLMGSGGYNTGSGSGQPSDSNCTNSFGGTSASTPLVSGIVALMLEANPNLTWRDVKQILAETAKQNDPTNEDWTANAAGYLINHNYGFGMVDAGAAVSEASDWASNNKHLPPETTPADSGVISVNAPIPSANSGGGITSSVAMPDNLYIENVEVVFNAVHTWRGDIEVVLTSPSGTQSRLMERRVYDGPPNHPPGDNHNFNNWKFMTVRNWGEHSAGTWTITVVDRFPALDTGTFQNWQLIIHGTVAPPNQPVPTLPTNETTIGTSSHWTNIGLSWNMMAVYADQMELQLDTVNPPVTTYSDLLGTASSYSSNLALGTYYWRVRAVDDDANTLEPDWADIPVRTFTVATSGTSAPGRNYFLTASPTLTWKEISWASGYQVEISTSPTFTGAPAIPVIHIEGNIASVTVDPPLPEGTYYWRVRARKADGITWNVTWGITDSFIVDLP